MLSVYSQNNLLSLPQNPIFIVGFPRSGTTLLQTLLATQDNIASFPETHFFDLLSGYLEERNEITTCKNEEEFIQCINKYLLVDKDDSDFIKNCLVCGKFSKKNIFEFLVASQLLNHYPVEDLMKVRWLEKTPGHLFHIHEIYKLYPEAKFIVTVRDPMRSFASYKDVRQQWGEEFKPVEIYADLFLSGMGLYEKFKNQNPSSIFLVKLEDLVKDHVSIINDLADFLEIKFSPETLSNFNTESEKIILPWETWKKDNFCGRISKNIEKRIDKKELSGFEKYRVYALLEKVVKKYGYVYDDDGFFSLKSNISIDKEEVLSSLQFFHRSFRKQNLILADRNTKIAKLKDDIKNSELIIKEKSEKISSCEMIINEKSEKISSCEMIINEKDIYIHELISLSMNLKDEMSRKQEREEELQLILEDIYNSRVWKFLTIIKKIKDSFSRRTVS